MSPGLTPHFRAWLATNGYADIDFAREDLPGGSFGGKRGDADSLVRQPVIFIHGNSDQALGNGEPGFMTGWGPSTKAFLAHGYQTSELYATSWGPASAAAASKQYHSKEHLTRTRRFIEAVLAYTGADKVDIVSHSMGVTLGRKAVLGGHANDLADGGDYNLGEPLTERVDAFVGIAGANLGLSACFFGGPTTPTCGTTNGFYPGALTPAGVVGRSAFLEDLNATKGFEGTRVFSIWSTVDEIIGGGDLIYGVPTSQIPGQTGEKVFATVPFGHFGLKDHTTDEQVRMVEEISPDH